MDLRRESDSRLFLPKTKTVRFQFNTYRKLFSDSSWAAGEIIIISVCSTTHYSALAAPLKELPVTKERVQLVVPDCCIIMIGKKVWKTSSVAN